MRKILILLMIMATNANATFFQFTQTQWAGYESDIPDTSVDYDIVNGNPAIQDFINTTRMALYKDGNHLQTLFGWSIQGIPAAYEHWVFDGHGDYEIRLTVEVEHNPDSPPWCNKSSDCYIESSESWTETFESTLGITILEDINTEVETDPVLIEPETEPEKPVVEVDPVPTPPKEPETPVIEAETPIEPVIEPIVPVIEEEPEVIPEPVVEVIPETIEEPEPELIEPVSILASDFEPVVEKKAASTATGSLSWLLLLPLIMRRR